MGIRSTAIRWVLAAACLLPAVAAQAQNHNAAIPVLVAGEDEDPSSVKRSSDIFKRVLAELKAGMLQYGFRVVDEEAVAAQLEWTVRDRRPKTELIQAAKLMSESGQANTRVRALVLFLFRIHAATKNVGWATKIMTRIDREIYDTVTNAFLSTYELPRAEYRAGPDCHQDVVCISETVGQKARNIATSLGVALAEKLYYLHRTTVSVAADHDGATPDTATRDFGLLTPYTVTLVHFKSDEARTILDTMSVEFRGVESVSLISRKPAVRRYEYLSTARPHKLEQWLAILLADMGFDVDRDVEVLIDGTEITIENLRAAAEPPGGDGGKTRFE